jgi:hypothetical protein
MDFSSSGQTKFSWRVRLTESGSLSNRSGRPVGQRKANHAAGARKQQAGWRCWFRTPEITTAHKIELRFFADEAPLIRCATWRTLAGNNRLTEDDLLKIRIFPQGSGGLRP